MAILFFFTNRVKNITKHQSILTPISRKEYCATQFMRAPEPEPCCRPFGE